MMTTPVIEEAPSRFGNPLQVSPTPWEEVAENVYVCRIMVCPEESGGFSAHAMRLPGVVSQGETIEESIANMEEAFRGALQAYLEGGQPIPWEGVELEQPGTERHILVEV